MPTVPSPPLFLGLDLSTQQLKAIIINNDSTVVHESSVHFDNDLPAYGTTNGAIRGPGKGEVTSPVVMWLDAIDLLFQRITAAGVEVSKISAISGAGQQHGSVYWSKNAESLLSSLDPEQSLVSQLSPAAFSLPNAPIWQDSSTTRECKELEEVVGGAQALADLSGSRAYERFTGNQISKIRRVNPKAYEATSAISLVSSFIPSVFIGRIIPVDISDASGMNLMNVMTCKWSDVLLEACGGPELRSKLGPEPVVGGTVLGKVSKYFVDKWGLSPDCIVAPFTGDNPASVIALSAPGDAVLSLGTSTTFLLSIPGTDTPPKRFTTSHLLSHPTDLSGKIAMLCYKNGALAREQVRDQYADRDWDRFNKLVEATPPGNNGNFGLYFPLPEIIPPGVVGQHAFRVDKNSATPTPIDDLPADAHPRAILESQFLSICSRVKAILPEHSLQVHRLVATGGSSANQTIRQIAADIFGVKVYVSSTKEAGGMGGALLAKYAWWKAAHGGQGSFEDMTGGAIIGLHCVAEPRKEVTEVYEKHLVPFKFFSPGVLVHTMEAQSSLKHTLPDEDISESASKRLKSFDSMEQDALASLPTAESEEAADRPETTGEKVAAESEVVTESKSSKSKDKRARHRSKKDERKTGRRRRGTRNEEDTAEGAAISDQPKAPRLPKRQSALLIGFCGSGYSGMQIQPDHAKTIEGVLFQALVRAGAVSQDNADDPVKIGLARAARTDAGVHAAGNLVSLKMITSIPGVPDVVARINEELPPEIRLWGFPGSGLDRSMEQYVAAQSPDTTESSNARTLHPFWTGVDLSSHDGELARKRAWRVCPEQVERLRAAARRFEGTHNFHNFTVGRDFGDRSNQRHMKKIEIADPAVYGDTEWISVLFHGQSFMLHQVLAVFNGFDIEIVLTFRLFSPDCLLLEEPIFESYNNRVATTVNAKLEPSHPDYRPPVTFEPHREAINAFKQKYIYDNMRLVEDRDGLFDSWMRHLDAYSGNDLLYLNPKGIIPPQAIIKKNERRDDPFREKKRFDATSFSADDDTAKGVGDEDEEEVSLSKKDLADTEG
ncbi:hypothetical protein C0995_008432 [Termitomyces sp. Mi166|nr:hypothetical protein C0995_008432 [Termitomyces sp. Mi166\